MSKPIIGAVHGYAVGGGSELALSCDLVVAAEDAQFGFPETGVGLFVGGGVTHLLPRAVGLARAKELILTGEFFDGRTAERLGLANRAVPADQVLPVAEALARTIMAKAPIPVVLTKIALEAGVQSDLATAMAPRGHVDRRVLPDGGRAGRRPGVRGEAARPGTGAGEESGRSVREIPAERPGSEERARVAAAPRGLSTRSSSWAARSSCPAFSDTCPHFSQRY